jgi:2Fe-2S ferredoxin
MSLEGRARRADRPVVRVEPIGVDIDVEPGETIIEAAWRLGYHWPTACYGQAWCTKCTVEVLCGAEDISAPEDEERRALANRLSRSGPETTRLACRAQPTGDISVRKEGVFSVRDLDQPPNGQVERPEDVLRRAAKRADGRLYEVPIEPDGTFQPLSDLTRPEVVREELDRLGQTLILERLGQSRPLNNPAVVGSLILKDLIFDLMFVNIDLWSRERRAFDMSLGNVLMDLSARPVRIALRQPIVAAVQGDDLEDAVLVPDDSALLQLVDEWILEDTVPQLIAGLRSVVRIGDRHLWGNVAVGAADALVTLSHDPMTRADDDQDLFFDLHPELAKHIERLTVPDDDGGCINYAIRRNCCLRLKLPDVSICLNCNLLGRDEAIKQYSGHQIALRRTIRQPRSFYTAT